MLCVNLNLQNVTGAMESTACIVKGFGCCYVQMQWGKNGLMKSASSDCIGETDVAILEEIRREHGVEK